MDDFNDKYETTTVIGVTESSMDEYSPSMTQENEGTDIEKGKVLTPEPTVVDLKAQEDEEWETDPDNARNWSWSRKWVATGIVSFYTFVPPFASSMMAPGLPEISERFHIDNPTLLALTLTIFLLSFALGPLFYAPLSEMYGRTEILHIGNLLSMVFSLGCAFSPNVGTLLAFRFLSGFSGSAPLAIGGGSVSDLFAPRDRASAMAFYNLGPILGPAIGPAVGGFITQTIGIKWVFIVIAITCGALSLISIPLLRETYAPVIRARKARRDGDVEKAARVHPMLVQAKGNLLSLLWMNLTRPIELLFRSFICFILSLFMSLLYGIYYLMLSTFPDLFNHTYGFGPGVGGLAYLGMGVGFFMAMFFAARVADAIYKTLADRNGGQGKPEMRMPAMVVGAICIPIGLLWYGWTAEAKVHWIVPIIGTTFFGFGMTTVYLPISLYLVDAFRYAASALAAASVLRSLFGFVFPLFGEQMFSALGEGKGNTLLACVAFTLGIPFPIWIYYKGEAIRAKNPLSNGSM
uniref:Major facilitator superfamily (MFS) profile domain-containing protein n=1 Tax=Psilocybe cubensis TaxID=181762 RepID=A0A8H7XYP4_PSICU